MDCLRELFWLSATYNFTLVPVHILGKENILPDTISRLHEKGKTFQLQALLWQFFRVPLYWFSLLNHMMAFLKPIFVLRIPQKFYIADITKALFQ